MKRASLIGATVVAAVLSAAATYATSVASETTCLGKPPATTPSACDSMQAKLSRCSSIIPKADVKACFCNQEMLNAFVYCKGESRECTLTHIFDSDIDMMIAEWQSACNEYLPMSITTPILAPISTVLDPDGCSSAAEACVQRSHGISSCTSAFKTNATAALSCLCQPTLLDLASRCVIDETKCVPKPVTVTNMWEYKNCQPTGWPTATAAATNTGNVSTGITHTSPARPSSSLSSFVFSTPIRQTPTNGASRLLPPTMDRWYLSVLVCAVSGGDWLFFSSG